MSATAVRNSIHIEQSEDGGYRHVQVGADDSWVVVWEGKPGKPWSQSENLKRANLLAEWTGGVVIEADYEKPAREQAPAEPKAEKAPNFCRHCGEVIEPTGKRGRPRVVHADCADEYAIAQEAAALVAAYDPDATIIAVSTRTTARGTEVRSVVAADSISAIVALAKHKEN
jgi:hypothetical protein